MDHDRVLKARQIFAAAAEMPSAERRAYLDSECATDAELHGHVSLLLAAHDRATEFMSGATIGVDRLSDVLGLSHEGANRQVGPYKLLELLGEGGFGAVYMAEQAQPVRRKVALKVIKLGMDTKQVIARFEAERQALAMMDHPNIAKVFEAGATDTGRPYFVMELVRGVPLTDYCDQNNLPMPQRLELFTQVCRAVQHAHQKGVIHRDLKPTNILVTLHDGVPVPKVIDFGVAKATEGRLTDRTLFTEYRQLVGTPQYMSPEQAEMSGLDVDTRSDVYSLGVLLYELLTGTTPFDSRELRGAACAEMQRIIREVEPPPPSTRLSTLAETLPAVAARRRSEPAKLGQLVRGELDWIVMKAIEKDRTRRYETPSALADDVHRYLRDELVQARPPGPAYKLRKVIRRNKLAVASAAAVCAALLLGLGGATAGFIHASAARDRALRAQAAEMDQRTAADAARAQAEVALSQARAVNDLLDEILTSVNRRRTGDETSFRRSLEVAAAKVESGALKDQPEIEAAVRATVGGIYFSWNRPAQAEQQMRAALAIRRRLYPPPGHPDLAKSLGDLGWLLQAKGDANGAEAMLRESLEMQQALLGRQDPAVASTLYSLGVVLLGRGDRENARPLVRESLTLRLADCNAALANTPGDPQLLGLRAHVRARSGDIAGAVSGYSEAIDANPENHWNWFQRAALRLYLSDKDGYRNDCGEMLNRFGQSEAVEAVERSAKACLLSAECAEAHLAAVGPMIDRALASRVPAYAPWFQITKGMYEYRAGRPDAAITWLRKGRAVMKPQAGRALADFYLAMSFERAGKHDIAEKAIANGIRLTPDDPLDVAEIDPVEGGSAVGNWVISRIARREAEDLIKGAPSPSASPPDGDLSEDTDEAVSPVVVTEDRR